MANPLNNVSQIGRIASEILFIKDKNDMEFQMRFTISVKRNWKNQSGEYENDYFQVRMNGSPKQMEQMRRFQKGHSVTIVGSLRSDSYMKNGERRYVTYISADNISWTPMSYTQNEKKEIKKKTDEFDFHLPFD